MVFVFFTVGLVCGHGCDINLNETFTLCLSKVRLIFELEDAVSKIPVIMVKAAAEASIQDWSTAVYMKGISKVLFSHLLSYINEVGVLM